MDMLRTLDRFGLGSPFIELLRLLYCNPMASVLTNGDIYYCFPLYLGTRQGCPLSLLISALVLEPLAAIRNNSNIKGVLAVNMVHKLFLYVDDLLVATNKETAVSQILSLIDAFSLISGYKINRGNRRQCQCLGCAHQVLAPFRIV